MTNAIIPATNRIPVQTPALNIPSMAAQLLSITHKATSTIDTRINENRFMVFLFKFYLDLFFENFLFFFVIFPRFVKGMCSKKIFLLFSKGRKFYINFLYGFKFFIAQVLTSHQPVTRIFICCN